MDKELRLIDAEETYSATAEIANEYIDKDSGRRGLIISSGKEFLRCEAWGIDIYPRAYDYCSKGERREDDDKKDKK